jgi:type IV fimbrial biogenesis protein FimT
MCRADTRVGQQCAFTLIELLVTLAVGGMLLAVAVPSFNSFAQNGHQVAQTNSLVTSLNYARSEAVKRDAPAGVTVCASSDRNTCNAGTNWAAGWIVLDPAANVLQVSPPLTPPSTLTAVDADAAGVGALVFGPNGALIPATSVSFTLCDERGSSEGRGFAVNSIGRIAVSDIHGVSVINQPLTCP